MESLSIFCYLCDLFFNLFLNSPNFIRIEGRVLSVFYRLKSGSLCLLLSTAAAPRGLCSLPLLLRSEGSSGPRQLRKTWRQGYRGVQDS